MQLALAACSIVVVALLWEVAVPTVRRALRRLAIFPRRSLRRPIDFDPGRERRAEQRARALLRSCVDAEDWEMYRDLGFLRVWGGRAPAGTERPLAPYAYLIYPHKPIVAYVPQTGALLNEYCVEFPDLDRPFGSARLPASDDVLAKWMALTADEHRLIARANMHLPGRQVDPDAVRRDLWRLAQWERSRLPRGSTAGSVPAP